MAVIGAEASVAVSQGLYLDWGGSKAQRSLERRGQARLGKALSSL